MVCDRKTSDFDGVILMAAVMLADSSCNAIGFVDAPVTAAFAMFWSGRTNFNVEKKNAGTEIEEVLTLPSEKRDFCAHADKKSFKSLTSRKESVTCSPTCSVAATCLQRWRIPVPVNGQLIRRRRG